MLKAKEVPYAKKIEYHHPEHKCKIEIESWIRLASQT